MSRWRLIRAHANEVSGVGTGCDVITSPPMSASVRRGARGRDDEGSGGQKWSARHRHDEGGVADPPSRGGEAARAPRGRRDDAGVVKVRHVASRPGSNVALRIRAQGGCRRPMGLGVLCWLRGRRITQRRGELRCQCLRVVQRGQRGRTRWSELNASVREGVLCALPCAAAHAPALQ